MQKIKVSQSDLEMTFEQFSEGETTAYLDTADGSITWFDDFIMRRLDTLLTDEETLEQVELTIRQQVDLSESERNQLLEAARIEWNEGERYRVVPHQNSYEGYRDMQEFIWSLEDERLRELLEVAIRGSGAFGRFKDVIHRDSTARDKWYLFRDARQHERILEWLRREGFEPEFV